MFDCLAVETLNLSVINRLKHPLMKLAINCHQLGGIPSSLEYLL